MTWLITASGLERLDNCVASAVLPRAKDTNPSPLRDVGNAVHGFLRDVSHVGRDAALEKAAAPYRQLCESIDVSLLPAADEGYAAEVAFRYDVLADVAEETASGDGSRAYVAPASGTPCVFGTCDAIGLLPEEATVIVYDYKTGGYDYGSPERIWQLRFYALAAARAYGMKRAKVAIIRIRDDGSPWYDWGELDEAALAQTASDLLQLVARVEDNRERVMPQLADATMGPWCKYCPSRAWCPAVTGLATAVALHKEATEWWNGPYELTSDNVPRVLERIQAVRQVLDEAEESCKALAEAMDIPLGDGWVLGMKDCPSTEILPDTAHQLLEEAYGPDVATAALSVRTEVTQAQLKRALKKVPKELVTRGKSGRPSQEALFGQVMEGLKARGGAKVTTTKKVMRYKSKAPQSAANEDLAASEDDEAA